MAMSARRCAPVAALLLGFSPLPIAADELPDEDFLEYLGSWEASDEDWEIFEAQEQEEELSSKRSDPAPEGEESTEIKDES